MQMQKSIKTLFAGINHLSFLEQEDSGQLSILPTNMQVISSQAEEPDLLICVDVDRSALRLARLMQSKSIRTVLVVSEPRRRGGRARVGGLCFFLHPRGAVL